MKARTTILLVLLCLCIFMGQTAYADTDGTELQILEPSYLEIQLGIDWAGTEFQLRTDMGLYPDTIQVDENGILHLEIGGSKNLSDDTLTVTLPEETGVSSALAQEEQRDTNADKETWPIFVMVGVLVFAIGVCAGIGGGIAYCNIGKR